MSDRWKFVPPDYVVNISAFQRACDEVLGNAATQHQRMMNIAMFCDGAGLPIPPDVQAWLEKNIIDD